MLQPLSPARAVPGSNARKNTNQVQPQPVQFGLDVFKRNEKPVQVVASIGPASESVAVLQQMIAAGTDVFRIDFAQGTHEDKGRIIQNVRTAAENLKTEGKLTRPVKIMADLLGPRIAIGELAQGTLELTAGSTVRLSPEATASEPGVIPTTYPDLVASLQPGNRVLINDGRVILEVQEAAGADGAALCQVIKPGQVGSRMGVNAPDAPLKTPALTDKDQDDLKFALAQGVEIITQSYPATDEDVRAAREMIRKLAPERHKDIMLVAKIERPSTVTPGMLRAITRAADAVMVARGDLGTEMGIENLPKLQKRIIAEAKLQHKPVIVANKLLGSMVSSDQPSRSDVFDLVQAVQDKAEMVMLTAETSRGQYPVEAVKVANRLIADYTPRPEKKIWESFAENPVQFVVDKARQFAHMLVDALFDAFYVWLDLRTQDLTARLGQPAKPAAS